MSMTLIFRRLIRMTLLILVLVPLAISVMLYWFQDNMIFFPAPLADDRRTALERHWPDSEINLIMKDGTELHGWYVKPNPPTQPPYPLVIYFGGNAEEVSAMLPEISRLPNHAFLLLNYRGYGLSRGRPGEEALYQDALEIYDQFTARADIDRYYTLAMGRSLGSGVAVHLASQRQLRGVILVSPYDSVLDVAQQAYPWLPVSLLLRHRFDSLSKAPTIEIPMLALTAVKDRVIPPMHSRRLIDAWGGVIYQTELQNVGHNTIQDHAQYWLVIRAFTEMLTAPEGSNNAGDI
ncbi:MAG: alpha/beta hydrolase [Pseudomonadota bacterium]